MSTAKEINDAYQEIQKIVGNDYVTDKDFVKAAYSRNVDSAFPDKWADLIVRPETTEEVSEIVKIANKYKMPIVPRGGGADLVSGSTTDQGILMDLTRINQIFEINEDDFYCIVGCGITWGELHSELAKHGLTPGIIGPGSGFSATIGGGLSNASACGGSTKYGLVPDICLGVEVVLCDPEGSIIRTGAWSSKYAKPHCRYGVSPDFTGLFCGDVGSMGVKTKAVLRLFPISPFKARRNYMLLKDDYNDLFKLMKKIRMKISDGVFDCIAVTSSYVAVQNMISKNRPSTPPKISGPVIMIGLEAYDQRILEVYLEQLSEIMKEKTRPFEFQEVDLDAKYMNENTLDWKFRLKDLFQYFTWSIGFTPGTIALTTCNKVAISQLAESLKLTGEFEASKQATSVPGPNVPMVNLMLLPNGSVVVVGGLMGVNSDEFREQNMKNWHEKIRFQVKYGGVHYWLGESISQSIVEAGAYTPEFTQFFKNIKKTVDPNYLLSPKKFHLNSYSDKTMENYSKNPLD
ncbi:MAG: FAD-binding oxidoreductase [Promethearchaeota archaeon]